jgi:O-antigen/teichoic acid export membrane protein
VALTLWLRENGIVWAVIVVPVFTVAAQSIAFLIQESEASAGQQKVTEPIAKVRPSTGQIIKLGLPISALLLLQTGTFIVVRQIVLEYSGEIENGLLHAALALAIMMNSLLISAIDGDYLRRLSSQTGDKQKLALVVRQQVELVVPLLGLLVAISVAFSGIMVFVLLSREFMPAVLAIQFMFISEFFRGIASIYGKTPFAFGRSWVAALPDFIGAIVLVIAALLLVPDWGADGAAGAFILSRVVLLAISIVVSDRLTGQRISLRELVLIVTASCGVAAAYAVSEASTFGGYVLGAGCAVAFLHVARKLVLGR